MALNSYLSIVTLNVNGLDAPIKRHRVSKRIKTLDWHSIETWKARKNWHYIFRALNEKNMQPRILYLARLY